MPTAVHATSVRMVLVCDDALAGSAPPGSGALTAVQVPPESVSISGMKTPWLEVRSPTATQLPSAGQATPTSDAVPPWRAVRPGAAAALQAPSESVSVTALATFPLPSLASYQPTATQLPVAGHEMASSWAFWLLPATASAGSGAFAAVQASGGGVVLPNSTGGQCCCQPATPRTASTTTMTTATMTGVRSRRGSGAPGPAVAAQPAGCAGAAGDHG